MIFANRKFSNENALTENALNRKCSNEKSSKLCYLAAGLSALRRILALGYVELWRKAKICDLRAALNQTRVVSCDSLVRLG